MAEAGVFYRSCVRQAVHAHDATFGRGDDAPLFLVQNRIAIESAQIMLRRVVACIGEQIFKLGGIAFDYAWGTLVIERNGLPVLIADEQ